MDRTRSTPHRLLSANQSSFFHQSSFFCDTFFIHVVSFSLILSLVVLVDQLLSLDLPLFISDGLCLFLNFLKSLIVCILLDAIATSRWNPFRILVTVLCGNHFGRREGQFPLHFYFIFTLSVFLKPSLRYFLSFSLDSVASVVLDGFCCFLLFFSLLRLQNSGGRSDNAAKSFSAIYDPEIHTTHILAQNSFEVVEALRTRKQPNDSVSLLSLGRLTLEDCVQEEKSQDLPRLMQIDGVEQRVTKSPRYLEGFIAQKWATRKGYSVGDKKSFEVSSLSMSPCTEADESGPAVSNSEKGSMREALKRDSLKDLRQHFGARRKDAAKGLCDSLAWKSFEGLDNLLLGEHSKSIRKNLDRRRALTQKHCVQLKKSQDLPRSLLSDCSGELAARFATGLLDGEHIPSLSEKKIARNTLKRKSRTMSVPSFLDHQQHVGRRWEDDVNILGAKRICRQLAIDLESTAKRIRRQHGTRRWPFKQSAIGLPDEGYMLSLSKKKIMRKTLKRKCRNMSVLSLEYHQHVDSKWEDSVNGIGGKVLQLAKHIYKQLVIHRVSRAKHIHKQHGIHRWPFQQNLATLKGYFLGDKRPVAVICLSIDGKLVSRLQLIQISWLGRFSFRPPALPPGGEIVGPPLALSSSQSTSNRAQLGGQGRSGSTASHSQNKRTTEPEPEHRKRKINFSIEDLRPHVDLKCADAAKKFQISQSTFKRCCRELGIKQWPDLPIGEVWKPPDPPERNTGQIEMVNEEVVHLPEPIDVSRPPDPRERNTRQTEVENVVDRHVHEPNHRRDYFDSPCRSEENDSMDLQSVLQEIEAISGIGESPLSTYPNPNLDVPLHPQVVSTQMVSGNTGIPNDQRNLLAFQAETHLERRGTGTTCSNPASSQDTSSVMLKVYGLRKEIIRFQFLLTSGIDELKGEVAMRLRLQQDSFDMHYEDDEGDKILIPIDKDLTNYLSSSVNLVIKLWVVPSPTDLCGNCGASLKR